MRLGSLLVGACVAAGSGVACADPAALFGGAKPGQSIEEIIAALPNARWEKFPDPQTGALKGAMGYEAVNLAGDRWTLRLGKTSKYDADGPAYRFEVNLSHRLDTQRECQDLLSKVVAAIEPDMGAYAPGALSDIRPQLASREAAGAPPVEVAMGAQSRIRIYDRGEQYLVGVKDVAMGAATRALVVAINSPDKVQPATNPRLRSLQTLNGYFCTISIAFRGNAQPGAK